MTAARNEARPLLLALLWIAVLGIFFFSSYSFTNWVTAQRGHVPTVVFGWERRIPFLSWTIVPYWSTDVLYPVSLLICRTRFELNTHVKRLVAVQVLASLGFLLFPLRFSYQRPEVSGFAGNLFALLMSFDKPFNQAPSLHLGIGVILWARYSAHLTGVGRRLMQGWLILVGVSALTTFQHHLIDIPTGIVTGLLAVCLFPMTRELSSRRLSAAWLTGSLLLAGCAFRFGGIVWLLLWPALAMLVPATAYAARRPELIGKKYSAMAFLLAPYQAAVWINSRLWTRGQAPAQHIASDVWIGRAPYRATYRSTLDVTAEFPVRHNGAEYRNVPMLDLLPPTPVQLTAAVRAIEEFADRRPTLVCCALGYSRSAATVATWLLATGRAATVEEAIDTIRRQRPVIVLNGAHERAIAETVSRCFPPS